MTHHLNLKNEKVLALANHIGRKKPGSKAAYDFAAPEYLILEPVVTDDMADVCMTMAIRERVTAEEAAKRSCKSVDETHNLLLQLADAGVCFVNTIDGKDTFWYDTWVPGIMEMMVNHPTNPKKFPQIAEAFEAYGRVRGAGTAGMSPVGVGLMRVIPIEQAIDGNSHRASYEEISKHIEEHNIFSVSNCSCRTAREIMGEGCGHLKEDMCIQMGHAAEYYIRTGRGREVKKEEVYEILRRAEENGLMHEIPNLDGDGKTHAICNCCGCGCFSLRTGEMFKNADMVRSNYISVVDSEKCVACGQCVENCPVNALKLGQKLCSTAPVTLDITTKITPRDTPWEQKYWNPDYRINREDVVDTGTAPCKTNCPAHIAVQGYIKLVAQGKYTEALELIRMENPLPAICGRICNRRCEDACTRGDVDEPIAIDEIKKFIAEQDLDKARRFIPKKRHDYSDKKVAVIGAGPAGLSCAYYLALDGYRVTVFEKEAVLGGMLTLGIPSFRLEKDVVNAEIDIIRELGVEFKTGIEIGKDITLAQLREQGYKAFYIAIGAQSGRKVGIEGEDAKGVMSGVDFLKSINLDESKKLSGNVIVIGGGNVAIDVARTAVRAGGESVTMYCLESRSEMPAQSEEIEEAESESIEIKNGWGPKRIITANGKVTGIELIKCVSVFDDEHRFAPKYDENDIITVSCDNVLLSIGQSIVWGELLTNSAATFNRGNTIAVDAFTYQSAESDVFAGGDAVTGPRFAIDAIAAGKQAAISIHRFVQPGQDLNFGRSRRQFTELCKSAAILDSYDNTKRERVAAVSGQTSKSTFRDLRGTFTEEQLKKETERCLGCGATVVDTFMCVGCGQCTTKCKFDAIHLERRYDGEGVSLENMKKVLVPHVIKRTGKIAMKKVKNLFTDN
ncbi:MAG: FAD-dependent oxidoreductase [Oscillospiraceae bacterium]